MTESSSMLAAVRAAAQITVPSADVADSQPKELPMAEKTEATTASPPAVQVKPNTTAELAATFPELVATLRTEAATCERDRILGIEAHSMPGHEKLIAECKADPAVTPDQAAGRVLAAERAARGSQLASLKGVEDETKKVKAAALTQPPAKPAEPNARDLSVRARQYQAEQQKLGIKVSAADAVAHVERQAALG